MLNLIECVLGGATTNLGATQYNFAKDDYGRFVCPVHDDVHRECLLSVDAYRAVDDVPQGMPQPAQIPAARPVDPNKPDPQQLLRDAMARAGYPKIFSFGPAEAVQWYVAEAWPEIAPVTTEMLQRGAPWMSIDTNMKITATVANGRAEYFFKGTLDSVHVYELVAGADFSPLPDGVTPPAAPPAPPGQQSEAPKPDDLTLIKGVGKPTAKKLNDAGITSFAQIAGLAGDELAALDTKFKGAVVRDEWVAKAAALVAASQTGQQQG